MLRYFKYKNVFRKPFKTALGEFRFREGIILVFEENEIQAFGEVAPLPGFSKETLPQVDVVLQQNKNILETAFAENDTNQIIPILESIHQFPSLSFGLDTLKHDLAAKRNGKNLSEFFFQEQSKTVLCNTTIGIQTIENAIESISTKLKEGFNTFKLKVGLNFLSEKEILAEIRNQFPKIKIRIDANQAWKHEEAIKNLNSISKLNIEYCEQPVYADDINSLKIVTQRSEINIAADEAVGNKNQTKRLIEEHCCNIVIIKPALMGLFENIVVTKELAETHNMEVVFTTTLDGIIGRTTSAVLASSLGSKKYAHGLATGSFFDENGVSKEHIKLGKYQIPQASGIGKPIDINFLEEII